MESLLEDPHREQLVAAPVALAVVDRPLQRSWLAEHRRHCRGRPVEGADRVRPEVVDVAEQLDIGGRRAAEQQDVAAVAADHVVDQVPDRPAGVRRRGIPVVVGDGDERAAEACRGAVESVVPVVGVHGATLRHVGLGHWTV